MLYFVTFVHIIAGMVFFALPMVFPRWYRVALIHPDVLRLSAQKMLLYTRLHLNGTAALSFLTGLWLVMLLGVKQHAWLAIVMVLFVAALINVNMVLSPLLKRSALAANADTRDIGKQCKRMSLFAGIHHSVVTLLVASMVFRVTISGWF